VWTREAAFSERNWHDTDEHLRSIRTRHFRLVHNAYTERPHGSPADVSESPSWRALFELKRRGQLSRAQARLFEVPRPEIEFYDLRADPWELVNLAGEPAHRETLREHFAMLERWRIETGDFPPSRRRRADNTDRINGVLFSPSVPPMTDF
jgi:arylsulfatase A-like enzyme